MICSKCGQELKEGAKFCTKCGTSFKDSLNNAPINPILPILSIILSVIGIIGYWVMRYLISNAEKSENYSIMGTYWIFAGGFSILLCVAIVVALIALNKQKSLPGFIGGLIPCANIIVVEGYYIVMNLIGG